MPLLLAVTWLVTFYDADAACTGKRPGHPAYGITRSGRMVQEGVTAACDRKLLGRTVWIEGLGPRRCDDTGRLVRGRHVDVYVRSHGEALRLGRQKRMVAVLP